MTGQEHRSNRPAMVPLHQILVDASIAAALLLLAIYSPLLLRKPLQRWAEVGLAIAGLILVGGIVYALSVGHWPFRG